MDPSTTATDSSLGRQADPSRPHVTFYSSPSRVRERTGAMPPSPYTCIGPISDETSIRGFCAANGTGTISDSSFSEPPTEVDRGLLSRLRAVCLAASRRVYTRPWTLFNNRGPANVCEALSSPGLALNLPGSLSGLEHHLPCGDQSPWFRRCLSGVPPFTRLTTCPPIVASEGIQGVVWY